MSTTVTTSSIEHATRLHSAKPSFFGTMRGEFFKIRHQWTTWIMAVMYLGVIVLPYILLWTATNTKADIQTAPLHFYYNVLSIGLSIVRVFSGLLLLILTARVVGQEYQLGTIRILLARGLGRVQLLLAKLLTVVIIALVLIAVGVLLNYLLTVVMVSAVAGNLNSFSALNSAFWSDAETFLLTVLLNAGVTILLATTAAVLGRSLTVGLSLALVFFPIDNIGTIIMQLAYRVTHSDFWLNLTAYFLGPNLNIMPNAFSNKLDIIGAQPLAFTDPTTHQTIGTQVDGTHTLVVALVYAAIFAVTAFVLTWRRDVKE